MNDQTQQARRLGSMRWPVVPLRAALLLVAAFLPQARATLRKPAAAPATGLAKGQLIDGQTVTRVIRGHASEWLARTDYEATDTFERFMMFKDEIPEEYAWAGSHHGQICPPANNIYIRYPQKEFLRLCQLELDTNSPHLIDGERLGFRYQSKDPE